MRRAAGGNYMQSGIMRVEATEYSSLILRVDKASRTSFFTQCEPVDIHKPRQRPLSRRA